MALKLLAFIWAPPKSAGNNGKYITISAIKQAYRVWISQTFNSVLTICQILKMRIFGYLSEISLICSNNIRSIKSICSRVFLLSSLFLFNSNLELANQIVANLLGCRTNKNVCYSYNRKSHSWNIHIFFQLYILSWV